MQNIYKLFLSIIYELDDLLLCYNQITTTLQSSYSRRPSDIVEPHYSNKTDYIQSAFLLKYSQNTVTIQTDYNRITGR